MPFSAYLQRQLHRGRLLRGRSGRLRSTTPGNGSWPSFMPPPVSTVDAHILDCPMPGLVVEVKVKRGRTGLPRSGVDHSRIDEDGKRGRRPRRRGGRIGLRGTGRRRRDRHDAHSVQEGLTADRSARPGSDPRAVVLLHRLAHCFAVFTDLAKAGLSGLVDSVGHITDLDLYHTYLAAR